MNKIKNGDELRPHTFDEFIGNRKVVEIVKAQIFSCAKEKKPVGHLLFTGYPGTGKTTLAYIVAKQYEGVGLNLIEDIGNNIDSPSVAWDSIFSNLFDGKNQISLNAKEKTYRKANIIIIDEIDCLDPKSSKVFFRSLEDNVFMRYGGSVQLPPFTMIAMCNDKGRLHNAFIRRFIDIRFEQYSLEELFIIVRNSVEKLELKFSQDAIYQVALRSRLNPAAGNNLLKLLKSFILTRNLEKNIISKEVVIDLCEFLEIDSRGLRREDRQVLKVLSEARKNRLGMQTICSMTCIDQRDFRQTIEPFLLQEGLIKIESSGRVLTEKGAAHLREVVTL